MPKSRFQRCIAIALVVLSLAACGTTGDGRPDVALSDRPLHGKFIWHDLITDDPDAARRFYGGLLGWTFDKTTHPRGGDYTLIRAGGSYIGGIVFRQDSATADYSRWLPYLSVADVDAAVALTAAAGGSAVVGPLDLGAVGRAAALIDPQGAVLGLLTSRVGDPDDSVAAAAVRIVWNELLAADREAAAEFYAALAGYEVATLNRRGGEYTMLRAQGRERGGIMLRPDPGLAPLWLTYFAVADVNVATRRAEDLGGKVLLEPSADLREGSLAIVSDPGGAILALQELGR